MGHIPPNKKTQRNEDIKAAYFAMDYPNFVVLAKQFGVSRQRIEQILSRFGIDTSPKKRKEDYNVPCLICKRLLRDVRIINIKRQLCWQCFVYEFYSKSKGKKIRTLLYPPNCLECNKDITKDVGKRYRGLCSSCYHKTMKFWRNRKKV